MTPHPRASEPTQDSPEVTVWRLRLLKAETENARLLAALKELNTAIEARLKLVPFPEASVWNSVVMPSKKARALIARLEPKEARSDE
jgi:hypothetical protein